MNDLNLEMFIGAQRDSERSRYQILGELQKIRREFSHNRIYPPLTDLIELYSTLKKITEGSEGLKREMPKRITGIDLKNNRLVYEWFELGDDQIRAIEDLIHWSLPHIIAAIEEGQTIFNFVDNNLKLEEVGILPSYIEEGYLLLPEIRQDLVHVIRYEISIFAGADQQYRNLKTTSIRTFPLSALEFSPGNIKLEMIRSNRDLPNPATYFFATDLDFPFNETILPVAKRKLLRQIYS
ncbi:MAG: hypothetical protein JWQ98_920 [Chlorobi bacterium]|nr:hypothetical protein [Chlorobiota bacterium]